MTITVLKPRSYKRALDEMRPISIEIDPIPHAEGSAYIKVGDTHVLCVASVEEDVPRWMKGSGSGWVTAEYALLPRSTATRTRRSSIEGGRTKEIQRLIGRSLRTAVDMKALGERQIILDCDVIRADGGTRCAAITGAWVALHLAVESLVKSRKIRQTAMIRQIAAVSVGLVDGVPMLDLDYKEDSKADVDANIVMTDAGEFVEIQTTAEQRPFSPDTLQTMLGLASTGLDQLFAIQNAAIEGK
ncbi:MAG TPA: ribonuclease PH [Thermomicrobiales bacterium]|nr:ribonuclease PH [Thermomicrobiales bacterium]